MRDYGKTFPKYGAYVYHKTTDGCWKWTWRKASELLLSAMRYNQEIDLPQADLMREVVEQALEDLIDTRNPNRAAAHADARHFFQTERHEPYFYAAGLDPAFFWRLFDEVFDQSDRARIFGTEVEEATA